MLSIKSTEDTMQLKLKIYEMYLRKHDYSSSTIISYRSCLSQFLRKTKLSEECASKEVIKSFLKTKKVKSPNNFKNYRAALSLYYTMMTGDELKSDSPKTTIPEIAVLVDRFRKYSLEIKHIKQDTVNSEVSHVSAFLEHVFLSNPESFTKELMAEDIRKYVVDRLSTLLDSSKGRIITSIRNFFRCQAFYGQPIHPSIFRLPLSPAVWRKSAFPTTIDLDIFNTLHKIPNHTTATGKRDCCIVLCFTELALRCSEVAALTLDDFNWQEGYIKIRSSKNGAERVLPLSEIMGSALVEYLVHSRPQTSCRTLFVRLGRHRGEPMGCNNVRNVIRRNSAKAGLVGNASGTHVLRRTAASKLYNSGNSLKVTADILGHESLDSTTRYAKTNLKALSSVASSWPGVERNVE